MKKLMTHTEVISLINEGYDMEWGWARGANQPLWHFKVLMMWKNMWSRCYDPTSKSYNRYIESIVHDDFKLFSNYLEWVKSQPRFQEFCDTCHEISWTVDKDMKYEGNKNYYPEYMTLCTKSENSKAAHPFQPVIGVNIDDGNILILTSMFEVLENDFDFSAITKCCKGIRPQHKRYCWSYLK